jgi:hypothetical protein
LIIAITGSGFVPGVRWLRDRLRSRLQKEEPHMSSAFDYWEMARVYLKEADATKDAVRKKDLQGIAKLYTLTALAMDAAERGGQNNVKPSEGLTTEPSDGSNQKQAQAQR